MSEAISGREDQDSREPFRQRELFVNWNSNETIAGKSVEFAYEDISGRAADGLIHHGSHLTVSIDDTFGRQAQEVVGVIQKNLEKEQHVDTALKEMGISISDTIAEVPPNGSLEYKITIHISKAKLADFLKTKADTLKSIVRRSIEEVVKK